MKKIIQIFKRYPDSNFINSLRKYFAAQLSLSSAKCPPKSTGKIAIEVIPDPVYFGLMGALMIDIKDKLGADVDVLIVRSVNAAFGFSIRSELRRCALMNWIVMRQWLVSYLPLKFGIAYRASSWNRPLMDAIALVRSYLAWRKWCRQKNDSGLDDLELEGIVCRDLIIDSYLRLKPSPFFRINDIFVWRLLWQALRDIGRARSYFRTNRPLVYLTTYSTYIEHGIPVRVALQEGVSVFSFGNFFQFGLQLTIERYVHSPDCRGYSEMFGSLAPEVRNACLDEAEKTLEYRMSGGIDHATGYMRVSAYDPVAKSATSDLSGLRGAVVVFLHDFYDSPHLWDDFIFVEFWDWIITTIDNLEKEGIPFFIKPHPNQVALSDAAIVNLRAMYPKLKWVDVSTNNRMLAQAGISCGITVYGTVAHELAYLGIPTIGAATHAHQSFSFCRTAKSREEYIRLLKDCNHSHMSREVMKKEALEFFVMHNSLHNQSAREVNACFMQYWRLSASAKTVADSDQALGALEHLRGTADYKLFISNIFGASCVNDF